MPQWRKLHAKIVESEDVNQMPDDFTRLAWTLMPIALDCEGRAQDDASLIRSKLFPKRRDVSLEMIEEAQSWYAERGMIIRYEVNGRHYFCVPTFKLYQGKTDREAASTIPEPVKRQRRKVESGLTANPQSRSGLGHEQVQTGSTLDSDSEEIQIEKREESAAAPGHRRDPVFDAIVDVCGIDTTIPGAGGAVGKVAAALKKASPPYTAEEIMAWGQEQAWRSSPPTVWQLKQGVSTIRRKKGPGTASPAEPRGFAGMREYLANKQAKNEPTS